MSCLGDEARFLTLFDRPESNQEMLKDQIPDKRDGTGDWFFNHPQYCRWKESPSSSLLWVTGSAYQGKSVLTFAASEVSISGSMGTVESLVHVRWRWLTLLIAVVRLGAAFL